MIGSPHHGAHRAHDLIEGRSEQFRRERVATGVVIILALMIGITISVGAMLLMIN